MRLLVLSDSHGNSRNFIKAVKSQPSAEAVLFLGDGYREYDTAKEKYPLKSFYAVKGNCDLGNENLLSNEILSIENVKIFMSHGAVENVKLTYEIIINKAQKKGCNIVLFGHTHVTYQHYRDGIYCLNPGSAHMSRDLGYATYGTIDITEQGIVTNIVKISD